MMSSTVTKHSQPLSPEALLRRVMPAEARRRLNRAVYNFLSRRGDRARITFLNFGYAPVTAAVADAFARPKAQLYEEVVGPAELAGKDILEVSSGRGGGAAHLVRRHRPRSYVGLDLSDRAVAFCQAHHAEPGLTFLCGDAEALPFNASRFDAVLNVEAAMNYSSMDRFVQEVYRVLRPGGSFLFADQCAAGDAADLTAALVRPGFEIERERDITANIVAALDESTERTTALIDTLVVRPLRPLVQQFAGVRGTIVYRRFASGELRYKLFALRKPVAV